MSRQRAPGGGGGAGHSREVLVELGCRGRDLFKILTLICFVLHKNQIVFQTNITEINTLEKNCWYCNFKMLIASLQSLFKASSSKRHCSRRF